MRTLLIPCFLTAASFLQAQVSPGPLPEPLSLEAGTAETKLPWSPQQATGAPDTPQPGDYSTSWAAATADQREEWLMLDYARSVSLDSIRIYESYNSGSISKVVAYAPDGRKVELVKQGSADGEWTSEYRLPAGQELETKRLRITINEPAVPGYNEIDAVGLKAKDGTLHWATSASASSFYGESNVATRLAVRNAPAPRGWSAAQVTGEPNTLLAGDSSTAWAPSLPDAGKEWLQTAFATPIRAKACEIYQSCGPGTITAVDLINAKGQPIATLQSTIGTVETRPGGIEVLRIPFASTDSVQEVRINMDTKLVPGWNEIDAVALVDQTDTRIWAAKARASTSFGGDPEQQQNSIAGVLIEHGSAVVETLDSVKSILNNRALRYRSAATLSGAYEAIRQKGAPWSPEQATDAPDTTMRGDFPSAWAPKGVAGGREWLRLEFLEPADVDHVQVHDSNLRGAITAIAAVLPGGTEIPLRLSEEPDPGSSQPCIVTGKCPEGATLHCATILVTLDTKRTPNGWPEIDAVELVARNGARQWAARATASSSYAENLGAGRKGPPPFERAKTLQEANDRMELLSQRLRALEDRIQQLDQPASVPPVEQQTQPAK